MNNKICGVLVCSLILAGILCSSFVLAAEITTPGVRDNANILTAEQRTALQAKISEIGGKYGQARIVIDSETSMVGVSPQENALRIWNELKMGDVGNKNLNVLVLFFTEEQVFFAVSSGKGKISEEARDGAQGVMSLSFVGGDYNGGFNNVVNYLDGEMKNVSGGEREYKKLSLKECIEGLEKRKKEYGIPDELCYWEVISKVYGDKCNLKEDELKKIFAEKEDYRNTPKDDTNWPKLDTDFKTCVKVEYDCEGWSKKYGIEDEAYGNHVSPGVFERVNGAKPLISVNPFYVMNKNVVQNTILIHEGLHNIQDRTGMSDKILPYIDLREYSRKSMFDFSDPSGATTTLSLFALENSPYKEYKGIYDLQVNAERKYKVLFETITKKSEDYKESSGRNLKFKEWQNLYNSLKGQENPDYAPLDKIAKEYDALDRERQRFTDEISLNLNFVYLISPGKKFFIGEENKFYKYLMEDRVFSSDLETYLSLVDSFKSLDSEKYAEILSTYSYSGKLTELDPRLSEVNRWWFDQNVKEGKPCEIIKTSTRAKDVLKNFLAASNMPEEYALTQAQLIVLMDVAKKIGKEEEIYNKLAARIPGLAYADEVGTGEILA